MNTETTAEIKKKKKKKIYFQRKPLIALYVECIFLGCGPRPPQYLSSHVNRISSSYLCVFFFLAMKIKSKTFVDVLVPVWGGEKNKLKYCNGLNLFLTNHVPEWHPKISTNYMFCGVT